MNERASTGRDAIVIAAICIAVGVYGWCVFLASFGSLDGVIGPRHNAPATDYMVYHGAISAWFDGRLPLLLDGIGFTAHLNILFADRLSGELPFHPWLYPPLFLLLLVPFGLIPFGASYAAFMATTLSAAVAAAWHQARQRSERWILVASVFFAPATSFNLIVGQNALLTAALLLGGLGLLRRAPAAAGGLLGVLAYKPQFWLMVPVLLVASRNWRALISAGVIVVLLTAVSGLLFGADLWRGWLSLTIGQATQDYRTWLLWGRLWGFSVFTCMTLLGAAPLMANLAQAVVATLAAGCVYHVYRRPYPQDMRVVVVLCATVIAAPHLSAYDLVLPAIAVTILYCRAIRDRHWMIRPTLLLAGWMLPLFQPPISLVTGFFVPVVLGLLIAGVVTRGTYGLPISPRRAAASASVGSE